MRKVVRMASFPAPRTPLAGSGGLVVRVVQAWSGQDGTTRPPYIKRLAGVVRVVRGDRPLSHVRAREALIISDCYFVEKRLDHLDHPLQGVEINNKKRSGYSETAVDHPDQAS